MNIRQNLNSINKHENQNIVTINQIEHKQRASLKIVKNYQDGKQVTRMAEERGEHEKPKQRSVANSLRCLHEFKSEVYQATI